MSSQVLSKPISIRSPSLTKRSSISSYLHSPSTDLLIPYSSPLCHNRPSLLFVLLVFSVASCCCCLGYSSSPLTMRQLLLLPSFLPPTLVPLSLPLLHVVPHRTNFFKSSNFLLLLFFLVICILPRTSSQQATSKQTIKQSRGA